MPRPQPRPKPKPNQPIPSPPVPHEVVDPIWLVKAIGFTLAAALVCGYLTFCLLFYQGQWQLVLHPTRTVSSPASIAGIPYEIIHFAPDDSAIPQLSGWWIPAAASARHAKSAILFLPGADGSVANSVPTLAALHNLGINVFAFDYRGYGQSAPTRPSQQNMLYDTDAAWQYLTTSRAIPPQQILPYGVNIGASLATHLASAHPAIPALILDSPRGDLLEIARHDPRSHLIPVRLLFHERFPLAEPLSNLRTPKLLLSPFPSLDQTTAAPKVTIESASPGQPLYAQSLTRFLDRYLPPVATPPHEPSPHVPSSTPAR